VQAQHDRVAADLILADQKLNDAKEALREIVGSVDLSLAKIPSQLPLSRPEPADIDIWRNTAQQSNLNIMAAKSAAEIAKENIDLYFAGHLPTLDVVGRHQISGNNRPPTPLDFEESSVGLYVTVPIYSGGGVDAQVEQARDLYEQSLHEVDRQRRTAERQVKDAFRGVLSAISRTGALQTALKSAQGALEAAEMGLRVGNRTVVDVLLEQTKFFQIRTDLAKSRYDFLTNGLLLKQAAGTLVQRDIEAVNGLIHTAQTTDPAALAAEPTGMTKATAAQTLASSHGGEVPPIRTRNRTW
jgi:outer membrane protein